MGDPTHIGQLDTGDCVSGGEGEWRVALQRRMAACRVVVGLEIGELPFKIAVWLANIPSGQKPLTSASPLGTLHASIATTLTASTRTLLMHRTGEPSRHSSVNCSSFWTTVDYKRRQGWQAHRPQVTVLTEFRIGGAGRI